jgi:ADP-dependent NAD(P)H-hydrate dehydratase / NAD(P)H-hydrate epimerase
VLEPLYTAGEMRAAEERYPGYPDSMRELMERAGRAVAEHALDRYPDARVFTAVCGSGSNGGDGRVAARVLEEAGREVHIVDAKSEAAANELGRPDVVVDALFGTGFSGEPRPEAVRVIEAVNGVGAAVVAVDVPSGVDASTGEIAGAAVEAELTVTFHGEKVGLAVAPGRFHTGDVEVVDIGLDRTATNVVRATEAILELVPLRGPRDNKYSAGHVLVVGGSPGMTGAPSLAALAALRADCGYVTVAAPRSALPVLEARLVEPVKRALPDDEHGVVSLDAADQILELAERGGALALGPGLGRSEATVELVRRLLAEVRLPAVVDADALWRLQPGDWPSPRVLTPHSGELGRLLDRPSAWVDAHRLQAAAEAVERFSCVVLLKGAGTIVAAPGRGPIVVPGNPQLATAGTGDVLTGIVASLLAKGMEPPLAAAAAATAHTAAAGAGWGAGLLASDLLDELPSVLER